MSAHLPTYNYVGRPLTIFTYLPTAQSYPKFLTITHKLKWKLALWGTFTPLI